jgi:hypothetical protein
MFVLFHHEILNTSNQQQITVYVLRTWLEPNLWSIYLSTLGHLAGISRDVIGSGKLAGHWQSP